MSETDRSMPLLARRPRLVAIERTGTGHILRTERDAQHLVDPGMVIVLAAHMVHPLLAAMPERNC